MTERKEHSSVEALSVKDTLKLALETLENNKQTHYYCEDTWYSCPKHEEGCADEAQGDECNCGADEINAQFDKAITAIKEALMSQSDGAQPAVPQGHEQSTTCGEPVAMFDEKLGRPKMLANSLMLTHGQKLFITPPQRTWVGLTDEQMFKIWLTVPAETDDRFAFARAIEAKLKQKNGYAEEKNT